MSDRRQRVLDAAIELFDERGYVGATADDIAARAGVTKRTLYRYMGSKQHVLSEIHRNFLEAGFERWTAVVAEGGTARDMLQRLISEHLRVVADFRGAIRVFFEEMKHLSPADRAETVAQRDAYQKMLSDVIKAGQADGSFRAGDPEVMRLLILGALNEGYRWYEGDQMSDEALGEFVAKLVTNGLAARTNVATPAPR